MLLWTFLTQDRRDTKVWSSSETETDGRSRSVTEFHDRVVDHSGRVVVESEDCGREGIFYDVLGGSRYVLSARESRTRYPLTLSEVLIFVFHTTQKDLEQ